MKRLSIASFLFALLALSASAQVTFIFHDGAALGVVGTTFNDAGDGSGTATVSEITLTAEAFLAGVSAGTELNGAGDGYGINADGTGDETQRFDNDLGIESMVFSFDVGGTFNTLDLRYIEESSNEGVLSFEGGGTYQLNSVTATGGEDIVTVGETFSAGQLITLTLHASAGAGENFALESFTVTSAVPEPSSFAALVGLAMFGFVGSRRRREVSAA